MASEKWKKKHKHLYKKQKHAEGGSTISDPEPEVHTYSFKTMFSLWIYDN